MWSDNPTAESKKEFICRNFKIDENEKLNQYEKLKEEVVKLFLYKFSILASHPKYYRKTDVLEFVIYKKISEKMSEEYQ